jgi:hypothetical protein
LGPRVSHTIQREGLCTTARANIDRTRQRATRLRSPGAMRRDWRGSSPRGVRDHTPEPWMLYPHLCPTTRWRTADLLAALPYRCISMAIHAQADARGQWQGGAKHHVNIGVSRLSLSAGGMLGKQEVGGSIPPGSIAERYANARYSRQPRRRGREAHSVESSTGSMTLRAWLRSTWR